MTANTRIVQQENIKGWQVEIVEQGGKYNLHIDGQRCNWDSLSELSDAQTLVEVVRGKLRQKDGPQ